MAICHSNVLKYGFGLYKEIKEKDEVDRQGSLEIKNDTECQFKRFGLCNLVHRQLGREVLLNLLCSQVT